MRPEHDVVSFRDLYNSQHKIFWIFRDTYYSMHINVQYHRLTKYQLASIVHNYGAVT